MKLSNLALSVTIGSALLAACGEEEKVIEEPTKPAPIVGGLSENKDKNPTPLELMNIVGIKSERVEDGFWVYTDDTTMTDTISSVYNILGYWPSETDVHNLILNRVYRNMFGEDSPLHNEQNRAEVERVNELTGEDLSLQHRLFYGKLDKLFIPYNPQEEVLKDLRLRSEQATLDSFETAQKTEWSYSARQLFRSTLGP